MQLGADQRRLLLDAARGVIRAALNGSQAPVAAADPALSQPAGCFVSLHRAADHQLRGCVGRLDACKPLIEALHESAANVLHDPRFAADPVSRHELPSLQIEITIVFPLREARDCEDFDVAAEGIFLTVNERSGCFLPQVAAETGWTRGQLLSRLCQEKLGLPADAWRGANARLMKFHTLVIGPEPFEPRV